MKLKAQKKKILVIVSFIAIVAISAVFLGHGYLASIATLPQYNVLHLGGSTTPIDLSGNIIVSGFATDNGWTFGGCSPEPCANYGVTGPLNLGETGKNYALNSLNCSFGQGSGSAQLISPWNGTDPINVYETGDTVIGGTYELWLKGNRTTFTSCTLNLKAQQTQIQAPAEPEKNVIISFLENLAKPLFDWLNSFLNFSIAGNTTFAPGQTLQAHWQFKNTRNETIPDSNEKDGTYSFAYIGWQEFGPDGSVEKQDLSPKITQEILSGQNYSYDFTYLIPDSAVNGKHGVAATLILVKANFNSSTGQWEYATPTIIDKQGDAFTVINGVPREPSKSGILSFLDGIISFFKNLFGLGA